MKKYIVQPGDSLYKISQKTGVRIPLLLASNPGIQNPSQLMPGTSIVIPELGKKTKSAAASSKGTTSIKHATSTKQSTMPPYFGFVWPHQASPSDTWESIAKKYGVSVQQLHHLNPDLVHQGALQHGHMLYVPTPAYSPQTGAGQIPVQPMPASTSQTASQPMQGPQNPADAYGPHSHHPYRGSNGASGSPSGRWFALDESSSFLSDWDGSSDMRSVRETPAQRSRSSRAGNVNGQSSRHAEDSMPTTDDDGWSETFTVRIDDQL